MNSPLATQTFAPFLNGTTHDPDGSIAKAFLDGLAQFIHARNATITPLLISHIATALSTFFLVRALETAVLAQPVLIPGKDGQSILNPQLKDLARWQDRHRRALKDIEAACPKPKPVKSAPAPAKTPTPNLEPRTSTAPAPRIPQPPQPYRTPSRAEFMAALKGK
jgi:hypothetical protein